MSPGKRPTPTWRPSPHLLLALLSALLVIIGNISGLAVGDDGVGYQAIADSLREGHGLGYFLERPVTIWPPLWPFLMSLVSSFTGLSSSQSAVVLNAITAFIVVLLVDRLLRRLVTNWQIRRVGTSVAALGGSSILFGHLLMTDLAFVAVMLGLFLALMNHRDTGDRRWLVRAAVLVWVAFMTRYAGIALIGIGAAWIVIARPASRRDRRQDAAIFAGLSFVVPFGWMIRNHGVDGTWLGQRYSSARGLIGNSFDMLATIGNFVAPGVAIGQRKLWALVAIVGIGVMVVLVMRVVRRDDRFRSTRGSLDLMGTPVGLLVVHIVLYTLYMLYARTTTGLNQLDFRLLNPIYLPLVLFALSIIDRILGEDGTGSETPHRLARASVLSWAGLSLLLGAGMTLYFLTGPDLFSGNYAGSAFETARQSHALDDIYTRCDRSPTTLSSNLPNALYEGHKGAHIEAGWSPRLTGLESNDKVDDIGVLAANVSKHKYCIIWLDLQPTYGHLATLEQLRQDFQLDPFAHDGKVTVYAVTALPTAPH